jgi:tetraacyldisaccharide 4'-kinase
VVGNISVGGSGKTPLIISLAKSLTQRGFKVGVVSRGFGATADFYPMIVTSDSEVTKCGDEPLLIAQKCDCPVVVDPNRCRGVSEIINEFACDVVLCDDGLQHYALHRDVEIVVLDSMRGHGNGHIIPAGPLREPVTRLNEVDFLVHNGGKGASEDGARDVYVSLQPMGLRNAKTNELVHHMNWKGPASVYAVAGIGNPERFESTLLEMGFSPILSAKNDHESLLPEDILLGDSNETVVVTEKDIVKYKGPLPENLWILEVEMSLSQKFIDDICHSAGLTFTAA